MTLRNTTDGGPAYVHTGNGEPHGPRVKRAGWRGWWLYDPDGSLVPDGHVEPVDPNARRAKHRAAADMVADGGCPKGHDPRQMAGNGKRRWCRHCNRDTAAASAARKKQAA